MGELIYIVNLDKHEYFCTIDKMTELELNPEHFHQLLPMMQYNWNGDRIKLMNVFELESLSKNRIYLDVSEQAKQRYKELEAQE